MMTGTDTGSCRTPWDRAAATATSFALPRGGGQPMPGRPVPHRQYRMARAERRRAAARRRHDIPPGTRGDPTVGFRHSCRFPAPSVSRALFGQRGVHHLLGLAEDGVQVNFVLEALGVDLVDGLGS